MNNLTEKGIEVSCNNSYNYIYLVVGIILGLLLSYVFINKEQGKYKEKEK